MSKRTNEKSKTATTGSHPETRRSPKATGAPGTASSKVHHTEKDARSSHDKDGNDEQRAR
jgi:hypothetical protein